MKCSNCGKELAPTAKFCNQCGTRVPEMPEVGEQQVSETTESTWEETIGDNKGIDTGVNEAGTGKKGKGTDENGFNRNKSLFIVIGIFFVAVLVGLLIKGMGERPADSGLQDTEDYVQEEDQGSMDEEAEDDDLKDTSKDSVTTDNEENQDSSTDSTFTGNVEEEVLIIREKYTKIVDAIDKKQYTKHELEPGVNVYVDGSEIKAMEIAQNVNMESYDRFYYFDEGQLFFAYWEDNDSHRMYFKDENVIRWRYCKDASKASQAVNYDLEDAAGISEKAEFAKAEISDYMTLWNRMNTMTFGMEHIAKVTATSALSERDMTHSPSRIVDGSLEKAWVEGADGFGFGESITIHFDSSYVISGMKINAGYQKNKDLYQKNSRPADISVIFSDETSQAYHLSDKNGMQEITFAHPVATNSVTIQIESVYEGSKYKDTVISEVLIY